MELATQGIETALKFWIVLKYYAYDCRKPWFFNVHGCNLSQLGGLQKTKCPSYLNERLTLLNNLENVEENIVHKNYS